MPLTRTHTEKQCFIAWAHSLRTPSFPLFLGRPVCQLLYRRDVEICTWERLGNVLQTYTLETKFV